MASLTPRQREILDHLLARQRRGLAPANLEQLCSELGLASRGSLHKQIAALVAAGLVRPLEGRRRGVELTAAAGDDGRLPLFGRIAAGRPLVSFEDPREVEVPAALRTGPDCYVLQVQGDSMIEAGILDGDLVVVEPRQTARNGETVVALVDASEATLKIIELRAGRLLLHPANPAYETQVYAPERVRIQGVVVGQMRRYA